MRTLRLLAAVVIGALFAALNIKAEAQSQTAFSYQGILREDGRLANGQFTMEFRLLDGVPGNPVGNPSLQQVVVADGVFSVKLDFGQVFGGRQYYLHMAVRRGAAGQLVPLNPPQPISPSPLAMFAQVAGSVPDSGLPPNIPRTNQPAVFSSIVRLLPAGGRGSLFFGPTDDCSLGIDPAFPGLIERDPVGFRLMGQNNQGCRLIFGPTMDCTVEISPPGGPQGLLLRDPRGIRILPLSTTARPTLFFGPTDDCSLGIDPTGQVRGLIVEEQFGVRITNPTGGASNLIFGTGFGNNPDNLCAISVDPKGPEGLLLRDPRGIRLLNPIRESPTRLLFGPTDDCSLGIDPGMPGLVERDPIGFRLLGREGLGCRLIFGPTMDCTVEVDPQGPAGLLLRDPRGIRILSADAAGGGAPTLRFGPTDDCSLGIDPAMPGLIERDPTGFRLLGRDSQGCRLIFGPTMDCTVEVDPAGPAGLLLRDPRGIRLLSPDPASPPVMRFGPTDDCSLGIDPKLAGLQLRDPRGIRILNPVRESPTRLLFGPTDDCSLGIDPAMPGLIERDPIGFRLLGQNNQGCRLIFGPTMDCTVEVAQPGAGPRGLLLRDPRGIRILPPSSPNGGTPPPSLLFGPTDDCTISIAPSAGREEPQMRFSDPRGFNFEGGPFVVNGQIIFASSRHLKEDIRPLKKALEIIQKLNGVRYTWKREQGGKPDIGFIAEEVGEVVPEVVSWADDTKTKATGVNYGHLVAVTVEGIKEQQTHIEKQQGEIESLKNENAALQERLAKLETLVGNLTNVKTSDQQPRHEQ